MTLVASYALVLLTILLTVFGQFAIKWQVLASGPIPAGTQGRIAFVLHLLLTPLVIAAVAAAFLASVSWMLAMTRLPLSHAYPMTALTFVLVVLGSNYVFNEPISTLKICGLILIVAGIVVGSRG